MKAGEDFLSGTVADSVCYEGKGEMSLGRPSEVYLHENIKKTGFTAPQVMRYVSHKPSESHYSRAKTENKNSEDVC